MQKVLITGITGMVGSHLADYLLQAFPETDIYGLLRWRSPRENIKHLEDKVTLVYGDLTDPVSLGDILGPGYGQYGHGFDAIYHLAAQSYVPFSYTAPQMTLQNNVIGTLNLLEAVRHFALQAKIHVCSSSEVYGQPDVTPITIDYPLHPVSPYGVSKAAVDMLAYMYWKSYKVKTVRTRAFTHTGPRRGEVFAASSFARQIALQENAPHPRIIMVGNLDSVRTWCDVRDMARAYHLALEYCEPGTVWNVGGNQTTTVGEMLDILLGLAKRTFSILEDPARMRPADVTLQVPDVTPFIKATGWEPEYSLRETLVDLLDWWRERVGH